MFFLILSVAALFVGPFVFPLVRDRPAVIAAIDGFLLASIGGLVLIDLLPHSLHVAGFSALVVAAIGLAVPMLADWQSHKQGHHHPDDANHAHGALVRVAFLGLAAHAFVDGSALAVPEVQVHGSGLELAIAVLFHRIPIGLLIAALATSRWGARGALWVAAGLAAATVAGFAVAREALPYWDLRAIALFQAFVSGTLLHVIIAHTPSGTHETHAGAWPRTATLGAVLGGLSVAALITGHPTVAHSHHAMSAADAFLALALATAPALLVAFLGAGLLHAFVPLKVFSWLGRGSRAGQALRGVAFGLPLSACSCGVLPFYKTLVARGAPPAAALAFLVATPEIGIDAVLVSVPLLGGEFTALRVLTAGIVAWGVAVATSMWTATDTPPVVEAEDSCAGEREASGRLDDALRFGFQSIPDHILPWVTVGLGIAALCEPLLAKDTLATLSPWLQVPAAALVGMPLYVCASGSTPLIAVLLSKGLSPGAALAFLLIGPATNATTFGALTSMHGRRTALIFCACMLAAGCLTGWAVDLTSPSIAAFSLEGVHVDDAGPWQTVSLALVTVIAFSSLWRIGPRGLLAQLHPDYAFSQPENAHTH
ncbi:MAG: uncharacterized membrane protein YraQ (UPF0718 family) [Hyphomicrobiaceae bacterium]|jgi:uncharacterized membrane protein YraQ (UPF0718 family)